jgi:Flp pilus assembly protein TadG
MTDLKRSSLTKEMSGCRRLNDSRGCSLRQKADDRKRTRQIRRRVLCERGQATVEMALASMIMLSMFIGIIEMALALYTNDFISEAAREGARYAMVRGSSCTSLTNCGATPAQIQTYLRSLSLGGAASATNMTVTTTWLSASTTIPTTWTSCGATECNAPGNAVQVKVSYAFPLTLPWLAKSTLNMSSTAQMVITN